MSNYDSDVYEWTKEQADALYAKTGATIIIWAGSCYGACDTPDVTNLGVDLLIQWGHSPWT